MSLAEQRIWSRFSGSLLVLFSLLLTTGCHETESNSAAPAPTPAPERPLLLTPNSVVEAALRGGESHFYRFELPPSHFADIAVEQRGVDVALRLVGPNDQVFPSVDTPNDKQGLEPLPLLGMKGIFRLEIRADPQSPLGRYAIKIGSVRPATRRDRARVAAEQEFAAAKALRHPGDGTSLRAAVKGAEEAVAQFEALGSLQRAAEASYFLGRLQLDLGQTAAAVPMFQKSLTAFRAAGEHGAEGRVMNGLCSAYLGVGLPREALNFCRDALARYQAADNLMGEATALNNLGRVQESLGRAEEALGNYDRALILWRRLEQRNNEGLTLSNRGGLLGSLGQTQRALDDLDQALPLLEGDPKAPGTLETRGFLRSQAGQPRLAADDLARALDLHRQAGNRREEAVALNDLGLLRQSIGHKEAARNSFEEAEAIFRELRDRSNQAAALVNLGRLRTVDGDLAGAETAFQRALKIFTTTGQPAGEAMAWLGLARVRRERGDLRGALRTAEISLTRIESLRAQPVSLALRRSFFAFYQGAFAFAIDTAMELQGREPGRGYDARALEMAEQARARTLLDALTKAGADPWKRIDPMLKAREASAREGLEAAAQRRQALIDSGAPASQVKKAELDLRRRLEDNERVEAEIRHSAPSLATFHPLTLPAIRKTLDPDTLLLEYALGKDRSFLWVLSSRGLSSYELPPQAVLEEAARQTHGLLSASRQTLARSQAESALAKLSHLLLGPAAARLGTRRLVVVPDGALNLIPFGALPDPAAEGDPLLARHEIVSVPSASSLAALRLEAADRKPPPGLVAVLADPVFDATDPRVTSRPARSYPAPSRRFPRLSASREEASSLLTLAPPGERFSALGFAARRELATHGDLGRFRILHFATHAVVDTEHPELSGIALSMVDERGQPRDGFLRAYEIYRLSLPADLVVLSACETALGKDVRGEGVVGLTRAFFHAGAQRVLVSLWPVEDRATADLMRSFYTGLFRYGQSPAAALRQAQDDLRRQPNRQAPHYWAGFMVQGDWR